MIPVRVAQLIYTRVEPPYSPQHKPGFQTVYKSDNLSADDITTIEKRVQCFQPVGQPSLRRLQFFTLNSGALTLTYTSPIVADARIVDRDRRTGAFLAHCIIISRAEFRKAHTNPFVLFDRIPFLETPEDMVSTLGQATGKAPLLEIEVGGTEVAPFFNWSGDDLLRLVTLATRANELVKDGRSALLYGEAAAIREVLEVLFYLTPRPGRLQCSFDTFIERCSTPAGLYWAVGASTRQGGNYVEVNASSRKVISRVGELDSDKSSYLSWLKRAISRGADANLHYAHEIQMLAEAFDKHTRLPLNEIGDQACAEFWELNSAHIQRDLDVLLSKAMGKRIGILLSQYLREQMDRQLLLNAAASQSLEVFDLSEVSVEWIAARRPDLAEGDWKNLQNFARHSGNMCLLHLAATLGPKTDPKVRDEALQNMDAHDFRRALERLLDPIPPADFVTTAHVSLLLQSQRLNLMSDEEFLNLIEALVKANVGNHLGSLSTRVRLLSSQPLAHVEKIIKKRPNIALVFAEAVRQQREALGPVPKRFGVF